MTRGGTPAESEDEPDGATDRPLLLAYAERMEDHDLPRGGGSAEWICPSSDFTLPHAKGSNASPQPYCWRRAVRYPTASKGAPQMSAETATRQTPGTRKGAPNPRAEASSPPAMGPTALPAEVAVAATPNASPCRLGWTAPRIARLATGTAVPTKSPVTTRKVQSRATESTSACGSAEIPASSRVQMRTFRVPNLAASFPPTTEPSEAARAPVAMIQPARVATRTGSSIKVEMKPGSAGAALMIATCTTKSARRLGASLLCGSGPSASPDSSCSSSSGRSSLTQKDIKTADVASNAAVTPKEALMPTRSAKAPPKNGPAAAATKMTICNVPSLAPAFSAGAVAETSTVAAATVPVRHPCMLLSASSCHGFPTSPINPTTTDPATVALSNIGLSPTRSPSLPHNGAASAMVTAVELFIIPAHAAALPASSTPSVWT